MGCVASHTDWSGLASEGLGMRLGSWMHLQSANGMNGYFFPLAFSVGFVLVKDRDLQRDNFHFNLHVMYMNLNHQSAIMQANHNLKGIVAICNTEVHEPGP